jgi:hypothetical protein
VISRMGKNLFSFCGEVCNGKGNQARGHHAAMATSRHGRPRGGAPLFIQKMSILGERSDANCAPPEIPALKLPTGGGVAPVAKVAAFPLRAASDALGKADESKKENGTEGKRDALTPRILEALAVLDAETARLAALSPRNVPSPRGPAIDEAEPSWLTEAAEVAAEAVAVSSSEDFIPAEAVAEALASEQEQMDAAARSLPVVVATLGQELRQSEEQCRHLRSSAEAQAATTTEIASQLELTKSAAESTAAAARRIVDDHGKDVALLLAELRREAPHAAAAAEARLSAPVAALASRRRHAQAAAHARQKAKRSSSPRPVRGGASGATQGPARSESPMLERIAAAAADVGREVVRRAGSPFRGRPTASRSLFSD